MSSGARPSSKRSGETIEARAIQQIPELDPAPAEWHDARTTAVLEPTEALPFTGINLLATGTPVEIKASQVRLSSGRRGRFSLRKRQHEQLLDANAAYLFAVYEPVHHSIRGLTVAPAAGIEAIREPGWTNPGDGRSEDGFKQLAWTNVLDPRDVDETRTGGPA